MRFPWVQNADEFVEKTLAQIEEFKKNEMTNQPAAPENNAGAQTIADKMTDLKKLLDQGILTQEEFDRKKQDLLDKM